MNKSKRGMLLQILVWLYFVVLPACFFVRQSMNEAKYLRDAKLYKQARALVETSLQVVESHKNFNSFSTFCTNESHECTRMFADGTDWVDVWGRPYAFAAGVDGASLKISTYGLDGKRGGFSEMSDWVFQIYAEQPDLFRIVIVASPLGKATQMFFEREFRFAASSGLQMRVESQVPEGGFWLVDVFDSQLPFMHKIRLAYHQYWRIGYVVLTHVALCLLWCFAVIGSRPVYWILIIVVCLLHVVLLGISTWTVLFPYLMASLAYKVGCQEKNGSRRFWHGTVLVLAMFFFLHFLE